MQNNPFDLKVMNARNQLGDAMAAARPPQQPQQMPQRPQMGPFQPQAPSGPNYRVPPSAPSGIPGMNLPQPPAVGGVQAYYGGGPQGMNVGATAPVGPGLFNANANLGSPFAGGMGFRGGSVDYSMPMGNGQLGLGASFGANGQNGFQPTESQINRANQWMQSPQFANWYQNLPPHFATRLQELAARYMGPNWAAGLSFNPQQNSAQAGVDVNFARGGYVVGEE